MTLLSICQAVCNSIPVAAPTSIVGNSNETAVLLLALANRAGETLSRRPQNGWVASQQEFTFTINAVAPQTGTVANTGPGGTAVVSGLSGVSSVAAKSWVASGTGLPNNSIVTAVTPTTVTVGLPASQTGAGTFQFAQADYQLPADFRKPIDDTFWDRTRYWQMRGPMSPQQWQLYKSSIIGKSTLERRYRFLRVNGATTLSIDPNPFDNGSRIVFEYISNAWCQSAGGTAQTSWQADTDTGILDEYLIQLDLQWRVLNRLGMAYQEEADEAERQIRIALAADGGAPTLSLAPLPQFSLVGPWNVPETGFGGITGG